ncbi:Cthe_2314 family HEPN domain-containing protein [Paenibacillus sp. MSJ-34]|uniref:Cthe_2314 family HEPN domain-containing protein n=1 Tax=Paenibacillus sp. MSJ-34 TaxID=2841529 RepID=UPI003461301D
MERETLMLRGLFGEAPRHNEGLLRSAFEAMERTVLQLQRLTNAGNDPKHIWRKYEIWARGLITSLDELEQSRYAAERFQSRVTKTYQDEMTPEEETDYRRHLYFYKNGLIRVFSVLDKLGTLLNGVLELNTGKVKQRFSYFTVLRQMRYTGTESGLADKLGAIKESYKDPMSRLRKQRNTEIHYMNSEMQDDLWQRHQALDGRVKLEDIGHNLADLDQALDMVCKTLLASFLHIDRLLRAKS